MPKTGYIPFLYKETKHSKFEMYKPSLAESVQVHSSNVHCRNHPRILKRRKSQSGNFWHSSFLQINNIR